MESDRSGEPLKVQVLLAEYEAAYTNFHHFDNLRWTIGSIFIAASLTLFGLSFQGQASEPYATLVIGAFSIVLTLIWFSYDLHVQPWVSFSQKALRNIEEELKTIVYSTSLHTIIKDKNGTRKLSKLGGEGKWIIAASIMVLILFWVARITWSFFAILKMTSMLEWSFLLVFLGSFLILGGFLHYFLFVNERARCEVFDQNP